MIKLLAIDVDGTLLDSHGRIPAENRTFRAPAAYPLVGKGIRHLASRRGRSAERQTNEARAHMRSTHINAIRSARANEAVEHTHVGPTFRVV